MRIVSPALPLALAAALAFAPAAGAQLPLDPVDIPPVTLIAPPHTATAGEPIELDGSISYDADGHVAYLLWDFGDGSSPGRGLTVAHAWPKPGTYTLTATAYDDQGVPGLPVTALVVVAPAPAGQPVSDLCAGAPAGVTCRLGTGETTPGGAAYGKVSHEGWPAVTGVYWVLDHHGRSGKATARNDELLGGHGSDRLDGGAGNDILWGDQWPTGNNTWQRDTLIGGAGDDFIYASHGTNVVYGGRGNDTIWSYFAVRAMIFAGPGNDVLWVKNGAGRVDCGSGRDTVHVPLTGYRLRGCERVVHYCRYGSDGHGGCRHGGRAAVAGRRR